MVDDLSLLKGWTAEVEEVMVSIQVEKTGKHERRPVGREAVE